MDMDTLNEKAERFVVKAVDKLERDANQLSHLVRLAHRGVDRVMTWVVITALAMIPVAFLLSGLQWLILAIIQ